MKRLCVTCVLVFAFAATIRAANQFGPWSPPVPLSVNVCNFTVPEVPAISKDGRSFYLHSACAGGLGATDLYVLQWDDAAGTWGPAQNLWMLNSADLDQAPHFSRDGHYLYFVTTRAGGPGGQDIWVSYREQTHDDFAWQDPAPVAGINSPQNEGGPATFQDKDGRQHMIFHSRRTGSVAGLADLYATDQLDDGTWTLPVRIAELSSAAQEQKPTVRFDGLEIIFESNRSGSSYDLWISTRATVTSAWSDPVPFPFNTTVADEFPYFSSDGNTLYFMSNRGDGVARIWMTTRERGNATN